MLFKILHGDASRISTEITPFHEGYCYVTHDGYMYIDMNIGTVESPNNQRIKLNALNAETLCGMSLEELKEYVSAQDIVVLGEAQTYTDTKIAAIDLPIEATDDEVMALLSRQNVVTACSDATGYTYTDIDEKILTL